MKDKCQEWEKKQQELCALSDDLLQLMENKNNSIQDSTFARVIALNTKSHFIGTIHFVAHKA